MIQLEIEGIFVDLYDNDPIRLNFNIEDLTDVSIKSEYSRQFRVPATAHNTDLFKTLFEVEGYDFDVTQKREASVLIDGAEFRRGEVRLLNIYRNDSQNKVDYEIVFLGSAKSLGSKMGNRSLQDLDLSAYEHFINYTTVTDSWDAYPEGGLTDGLFDGDIIYPLINFGNKYDGSGTITQPSISVGKTHSFDAAVRYIETDRFRPMMRAKALIDKIFEEAGFTYDSNFLNSNEFKQIYLSGWGNDTDVNLDVSTSNLAKSGIAPNDVRIFYYDSAPTITSTNIPYQYNYFDYGNNLAGQSAYTTPLNGDYVAQSTLTISASTGTAATTVYVTPFQYNDGGALVNVPAYEFDLINGGTQVQISLGGVGVIDTIDAEIIIDLDNPSMPIEYRWEYTIFDEFSFSTAFWPSPASFGSPLFSIIAADSTTLTFSNGYYEIVEAVGESAPSFSFDTDYKQIDFMKDIFKMFRLVMIPDVNNPSNFKIEPWEFYIGSGDVKDWSNKVDLDKDKVIKPTVLEQKDRLYFEMDEDKDFLNDLNLKEFKETFGTQIVNSGYEILDGEQRFTTSCAPTPATQILGYASSTSWDDVIITQICTEEPSDVEVQYKPIKPKPRFLYYNGLKSSGSWYLWNGASAAEQTEVPMVSYYSQFPPNPNAKILNFQKENGYDQEDAYNPNYGIDLYSRYWANYISSVYDKWGRRLTAYFNLDSTDILNFDYDDVIFIEGSYYYVERIYDAPLEGKSTIKVDLIKLLNYNVGSAGFIPPIDLNIWNLFGEVWNVTTDTWND